jgi:hypothetical protein
LNAKDAKKVGLGWLVLKIGLPDGSRYEVNGPFSVGQCLAAYKLVTDMPEVEVHSPPKAAP